jgi:hypothetical protein
VNPERPLSIKPGLASDGPGVRGHRPLLRESEHVALAKHSDALHKIHALGSRQEWDRVAKLVAKELTLLEVTSPLRSDLSAVELQAKHLSNLEEVQTLIGSRWQKPPQVQTVEQRLAALLEATGDARLVTRVQRNLAFKAAWEGHAEAAQKLLPPGAPDEDALTMLRDLKTVLLGEGDAGVRPPGGGMHGPPAPEQPLLPEGSPEGVRPSLRESAQAGLLEPEEESSSAQRSYRPMDQEIRRHAAQHRHELHFHLDLLHRYSQQARGEGQEKDDRQRESPEAAVAKLLTRELTPSERILVRQMHQHGKRPEEMAKILRQLKPAAP